MSRDITGSGRRGSNPHRELGKHPRQGWHQLGRRVSLTPVTPASSASLPTEGEPARCQAGHGERRAACWFASTAWRATSRRRRSTNGTTAMRTSSTATQNQPKTGGSAPATKKNTHMTAIAIWTESRISPRRRTVRSSRRASPTAMAASSGSLTLLPFLTARRTRTRRRHRGDPRMRVATGGHVPAGSCRPSGLLYRRAGLDGLAHEAENGSRRRPRARRGHDGPRRGSGSGQQTRDLRFGVERAKVCFVRTSATTLSRHRRQLSQDTGDSSLRTQATVRPW
jgi:hypothetical protein